MVSVKANEVIDLALKWWQTVDLLERDTSRAKAGLDWMREQQEARARAEEEREAAEREKRAQLVARLTAQRQQTTAIAQLETAGIWPELITGQERAAAIQTQIQSGFRWAEDVLRERRSERALELAGEWEKEREAEEKQKAKIRAKLLKEELIGFDTPPEDIEKLVGLKLAEGRAETAFAEADLTKAKQYQAEATWWQQYITGEEPPKEAKWYELWKKERWVKPKEAVEARPRIEVEVAKKAEMPPYPKVESANIFARLLKKFPDDPFVQGVTYFNAGCGDAFMGMGNVAKWLGKDKIGDALIRFGEPATRVPISPVEERGWRKALNPRYYITEFPRAMPFTLSLVPMMIAGAYAGGAIGTAFGIGFLGRFILKALGAVALSRPMESALEAGETYDQAITSGIGEEEANRAANEVFRRNLKLAGLDAAQIAAAFAPGPAKFATSALFKTVTIAGKVVTVGLSEAGEEAYQNVIQRQALGRDVKLDAEMQEVMLLGGLMGMGMGGVGGVYTNLINGVKERLSPGATDAFNGDVANFEVQGLDRDIAELRAMDNLVQTEEGQKVISNVLNEIKVEEAKKEATAASERVEVELTPIEKVAAEEAVRAGELVKVTEAVTEKAEALFAKGWRYNQAEKAWYKPVEAEVAKPVPVPKAPEVPTPIRGEQVGMLGVPGKVVTQRMLGEYVTAGMEDYAKLKTAMEAKGRLSSEDAQELTDGLDLKAEVIAERIDTGTADLEGMEAELDPRIARLTEIIPKTKEGAGELLYITKGDYRILTGGRYVTKEMKVDDKTVTRKVMIGGREPKPGALSADGKHVRWEYALDEIATELGLEAPARAMGIAADEHLKNLIEKAKRTKDLIRATRNEIEFDKESLKNIDRLKADIQARVSVTTTGPLFEAVSETLWETGTYTPETIAKAEDWITTAEEFEGITKVAEVEPRKLRQTIMGWVKQRGLPQTQLNEILKGVVGKSATGRQLPYRLTRMTVAQLEKAFTKVKAARPRRIRSKVVITAKTERKISSLKSSLEGRGEMDDVNFARLMKDLKLATAKYESQYKFITESEGKELIKAMLDEAEYIGFKSKGEVALKENPKVASQVADLKVKIQGKRAVYIEGKPVKDFPYVDMRYYVESVGRRMGQPLYEVWQWMNNKHLKIQWERLGYLSKLERSTPIFKELSRDDVALKRVSDYIASKHKLGPKSPANITEDEIKLAKELERQLAGWQGTVRFVRFLNAYDMYGADAAKIRDLEIHDAPIEDLRKAIDIYEGKGKDAVEQFLEGKDWGVIRSGYEPLSVVSPKIYLFRPKPPTLGKGHIKARAGIQYPAQDRNILQRYTSYIRQIQSLLELSGPLRQFVRVFDEGSRLLARPTRVAEDLSRALNEMKGYSEVGGPFGRILSRLYAQTMAAVFFDPKKWIRNLCQNIAFYPDKRVLFDPRNEKLTGERLLYSDILVSQKLGMMHDYLMRQFKPLRGLGPITQLANKISRYPWTDETNRRWCFGATVNEIDRALADYRKDGDLAKLMKRSMLADLEWEQQVEALELLVQDKVDYNIEGLAVVSGEEAFARQVAREITNNTQFMYDRSQRAPAEMGSIGRILGNLLVFPRSYLQRMLIQGRKLKPGSGATHTERGQAAKVIVSMLVCGMLIGEAFKKLTGTKYNPYSPLTILTWTPGGLSIGVAIELSKGLYDTARALTGDKEALNRATSSIPRSADLILPFYDIFIESTEALTDKKNVDRYALRKLREAIDKEYEVRPSAYIMKRNFVEKIQHIFFGGEPPELTEEEEEIQKIKDSFAETMGKESWGDLSDGQKDYFYRLRPDLA